MGQTDSIKRSFPRARGCLFAKAALKTALIRKYKWMYIITLPGILYYLIFKYLPIYGVVIAFKDVSPLGGFSEIFFGGTWVGLKHFSRFIHSYYFWNVFTNTLVISLYNLVFGFPAPILLALIINEVRNVYFKRIVQTISYLPHFVSVVVVTSLAYSLLSTDGAVNGLVKWLGREPVFFLGEEKYFRTILVTMNIWKNAGWSSIIYLAALAGINQELYDAATVDGAGKLQQMLHVTLPGISHIIVVVFILRLGHILDAGFEEVLLLYSPPVYRVADIIDTFVYREGLEKLQYSYTAAVGIFKSVIALLLVLGSNKLAKRFDQQGIW